MAHKMKNNFGLYNLIEQAKAHTEENMNRLAGALSSSQRFSRKLSGWVTVPS
jgi:hypothetical protein